MSKPSPFLVSVGDLRRNLGMRRPEHVAGPLADLVVTGSAVPAESDVVLDLALDSVPGAVVAAGTIRAPWVGECRRCLQPVGGEVRTDVREVFEETPDPEETYPLVGDHIDLEPLARDAVLLELPQAPLCAEDCKGLCPTCGANRNEGDCGCVAAPRDERWAGLDALRQQLEDQ